MPAARDSWLEQTRANAAAARAVGSQASGSACEQRNRGCAGPTAVARWRLTPQRAYRSLEPGDRIGPYRLKREIGSWWHGRCVASRARRRRLYARGGAKLPLINRLRRDLAQRFARERDILARLEHPHIARLYDAGVSDDGLPYLAMEYVDGQPITAILR